MWDWKRIQAQGDKTTITPTEPSEIPLAIPVNVYECNTPTKGAILAVEKLSCYYSCVKCFKKVIVTPDLNIVKCSNCSLNRKTKACKQKWVAQVLFDIGHENILVTIFDNIFQALLKDLKLPPPLTESQMTEMLLTLPTVKLTYDKKKIAKSISINA